MRPSPPLPSSVDRPRCGQRRSSRGDGYLAATAHCHEMTVVTRNVADFVGLRVALLNPWQG
ncbi:hypothetical protein C1N62_00555 [Nissabacter sp. SGAir0207]|nr:hypothetical protein C1N62_00555 [Nissabacter sp. SGAir0207]